ncbi:hypothetical protein O1611_g3209 [Lasiodiplodia mahajangana]|uniref:Uncharacterized protein n=1 Tax=Lasiodiplodia mahajangana TaxID=1108764 RepID=A0ACC2JSF5_9PEZI|nr:hypothetical protein O1611_g3209 [Lasiodiplodia mahajangana]
MLPKSSVNEVCPDNLSFKGTALEAFDRLKAAQTNGELLSIAHYMFCSPSCLKGIDCKFLHYTRGSITPVPAQAPRCRDNKRTAALFSLMGGTGYIPGTPQVHEVNTWSLIEAPLAKVDSIRDTVGLLDCDYTDWSKKHDQTAEDSIKRACRDYIQFMGTWLGAQYGTSPAALHLGVFTAVPDDICIPPIDLVNGSFCVNRKSVRDVFVDLEREGWGRDATHLLLVLIRQYFFQYVEKVGFDVEGNVGLHSMLNRTAGTWDSVVYRTHTANTFTAAVLIARISSSGPLSNTWIMDSSICDAISMDLVKSALQIYQQDNHQPTAGSGEANREELVHQRKAAYHSIYLELIDDLVFTGAPEPIVHFGQAGFLFVQMNHRYLERRAGHRFPITPRMESEIRRIFGDSPTDARLDGLFRLRWLLNGDSQLVRSSLPPELLADCRNNQLQHQKGLCKPAELLHSTNTDPEDK